MSKSQSVDSHNSNLNPREAKDWERFQELRTLCESGDNANALAGFQDLAANSSTPRVKGAALSFAALCLRNLGRLQEAKVALAPAFEGIGKGSEAYAWLLYCSASLDFEEGNWKSALTKFDTLLSDHSALLNLPENQSESEYVSRKRGVALLGLDRPQEALPLLEHAATLDDEREFVSYCLGKCCYKVGDFERAERYLREATESNLHRNYAADERYHLGLACYCRHKYAWAIKELEWCLNNDVARLVPRAYVLKGLINAAKELGLDSDADRYAQMLKELSQ